jgi:hypothetical protein
MTSRQNDIRRLAVLPTYLAELAILTGREVSAEELLTEQETSVLRDEIMGIPRGKIVRAAIPFEGRTSEAFAAILEELRVLNPSPVVLWPPKANDCGVLLVPSLKHINFAFPFDVNPEGILVIATKDGCDRMVLEFSDEDDGRSLEIELHGKHWSQATLPNPDSERSTPRG